MLVLPQILASIYVKAVNLRVSIFKLQSSLFRVLPKIINYDTISNYRHSKVIYWYGCAQKKLDSSYQNGFI